jgi:hypothetical protein
LGRSIKKVKAGRGSEYEVMIRRGNRDWIYLVPNKRIAKQKRIPWTYYVYNQAARFRRMSA